MSRRIDCGFIPLIDAAPLIVAVEIGFAAEEGIEIVLHREMSWASLRDRLIWGRYHAAHMLAPVIVAQSAGLGAGEEPFDALMLLSVNGEVIGVRPDLAAAMRAETLPFGDAAATGRALIAAAGPRLRVGVPFHLSMHAELVAYWMEALGAGSLIELATVPPPRMAAAMAAGEVDAFCVGEPWGSVAVETGAAELILAGPSIWRFAPEKALAMPRRRVEADPATAAALMRAVWRAAQWAADPANAGTLAELLSRREYLDLPSEILERPLAGRLVVNARGGERRAERCVEFFAGAANFPWRSQGLWIADAIARRTGADRRRLRAAARASFRTDLFRDVLGPIGADLPGASEKLEGSLANRAAVASTKGKLLLGPDSFFDGRVFDPSAGD